MVVIIIINSVICNEMRNLEKTKTGDSHPRLHKKFILKREKLKTSPLSIP